MLSIDANRCVEFRVPTSTHHSTYYRADEVQLNDEELRQMAMRTHETFTHALTERASVNDVSLEQASIVASISMNKTTKSDQRQDGTLSDSVLSNQMDPNKKRRPSTSKKALVVLGLSKKANSTSNLGHGKSTR
jgi:hypothetical protein